MTKEAIIKKLKELKPTYQKDGLNIIGVFGSMAKETSNPSSDIDIAYSLDKEIFFSKYQGFESASKIADTKESLSKIFQKKVDFISLENSNKNLVKNITNDLIYV